MEQKAVKKILITGASGFIGRALTAHFRAQKAQVFTLTRSTRNVASQTIYWNPKRQQLDLSQIEGFDAVIHLSGESLFWGRWTERKKKAILLSRTETTRFLAESLIRLKTPPKVVLCASAVGFYGNRGNEILTEKSSRGEGFLSDVCVAWEAASNGLEDHRIRVIHARFGAVLSQRGGFLKKAKPLFRFGLGAVLGSGNQWMSWISLEDLIHAVDFTLQDSNRFGTYNFVSPQPVSNKEFTQALAKALHRRAFLTLPAGFLRLLLGEIADAILLASCRAIPDRLVSEGFKFHHPNLEEWYYSLFNSDSKSSAQ